MSNVARTCVLCMNVEDFRADDRIGSVIAGYWSTHTLYGRNKIEKRVTTSTNCYWLLHIFESSNFIESTIHIVRLRPYHSVMHVYADAECSECWEWDYRDRVVRKCFQCDPNKMAIKNCINIPFKKPLIPVVQRIYSSYSTLYTHTYALQTTHWRAIQCRCIHIPHSLSLHPYTCHSSLLGAYGCCVCTLYVCVYCMC